MRQEGMVYYIHSDHLGSTSLTTDQNQQVEARQVYYPYGTPRWSQGTLPTDYTFTLRQAQDRPASGMRRALG